MKKIKTKVLLLIVLLVAVLVGSLIVLQFFSFDAKWAQLEKDLAEADSVEECESTSNEMADLWNSSEHCSDSFGERVCILDYASGRSELAECSGRLAGVQRNLSFCDNKKFDALKDECLLSFLVYSDDEMANSVNCDDFYDDSNKNKCFSYMAAIKSDFSYCNKIDSKFFRDQCIRSIAFDTNNRDLCREIGSRKNCEEDFDSFLKKDFSVCRGSFMDIIFGQRDAKCIKDFAIFNNKPLLCNKIDYKREECLIFSR